MPRQRQSQTNEPAQKKNDTAVGVQDIGNKTPVTGESSWPKRKSTSASEKREVSKGKKPKGKLTLSTAIL